MVISSSCDLRSTILRICVVLVSLYVCQPADASPVQNSVLCPEELIRAVQENAERLPWAARIRDDIVASAQPWMEMSEDELWGLMFGNTITRSWMVWSNGHCPVCGEPVAMYGWEIDAIERPWKVRCPRCGEIFPKNDFEAFYKSGLDEHGVFDPERADRSLLFNVKHPDPEDPRHMFGVDDGEGYVAGDKRWRFIGAYLVRGPWKQMVLGGIRRLADTYVVTGDTRYAHRAGILLDRVADLYPSFDYEQQGLVYERPLGSGYVSVWHDACRETQQLALAYDQVRPALADDEQLASFLAQKAEEYDLPNPKSTPEDVLGNIEDGILRDPLAHRGKIISNFPRQDIAVATLMAVLDWPDNRDQVMAFIDSFLQRATAVDGLTGEKGLAGYSASVIQSIALFLARWERAMPGFLEDVLVRHPQLHDTYRFHIDTWCLYRYYPLSGDTGHFAAPFEQYRGVRFRRPGIGPSMFTFMWHLYELTGDPAFVQMLYLANDQVLHGLPWDVLVRDPESVQRGVQAVIDRHGAWPRMYSVNKREWQIAILRSGQDDDARAAWLDYDSGTAGRPQFAGHVHFDGMNLGLFAYGLDLMPEFGYPPVQFGGWFTDKVAWYKSTAAHNTVVVDGGNQVDAAGQTTLWVNGQRVHVIRASAPGMIGGQQYERTVAMIDVSPEDFYVLDIFRVVGGTDHAKFMHSHFGTIATTGLDLQPSEDYGHGAHMRNFHTDAHPAPGWSATWDIEDRYGLLEPGARMHLRYTDLTADAEASIAEAWIVPGRSYSSTETAWIPRLMIRRRTDEGPLASTFVGVIEPYERRPVIADVRRLHLQTTDGAAWPDSTVGIEVTLRDGRHDLFVVTDVDNPLGLAPSLGTGAQILQDEWGLALDGQWCFARLNGRGELTRLAVSEARSVEVGPVRLELEVPDLVELTFTDGRPQLVCGRALHIGRLVIDGEEVPVQ